MIAIYRTLFGVSVLLLVGLLILPARTGIPIQRRLSQQTNDWTFAFATTNQLLFGATPEQTKTLLLRYLHEHRTVDEGRLDWLALGAAVSAIFSLAGWRREIYWRKQN
ncbi:MAG TPA: hypothetical protein VL527_17970 [Dongiaceae bacterium]|jgi:hypothetical protein|nr:hypothetical protein [Dongiaceae bacterium]